MGSPEINPYKYSELIFDKEAKAIQGEKIVSSINGDGTTGYQMQKKKKI